MSLKNLKKIFVVCFLSGACASLNARATLPFLDEWAKSLDYSNEKAKYVDLTWGAVAIETGFIHNLRFFGDYQINTNDSGKRIYAGDTSTDPLFAIIRELFPSTGGVLSINVGGNVPKLCNELSCIDIGKIINYCFLSENCNLFSSGQDKQPKNKEKWINDCLKETRIVNENEDRELKTSKRKLLGNIYTILNEASRKKASNMQKHKKEVLAQVLLAFLYEKINLQGLKIKDTTAIYKKAIIAHEKNVPLIETVGGLKAAFGEEMFLETIPQIEEETEYNKASIAARSYFNDLWQDNPFPYIAAPIQNGLAQAIQNDGTPRNTTFPDCVEVAIRHFFNIILYNPSTGNFDYENFPIVGAKKDLFSNFYKNLQPTRDLANNGSIELRTEWNKIMTHIPEVIYKVKDDGKSINANELTPYNKTENENVASNEIKAGVINLYNVLAYLLEKDPIQTGTKGVSDKSDTITRYGLITQYTNKKTFIKSMLVKNFKELFKIRTVTIKKVNLTFYDDDSNNKDECDLYGDITIEGTKTINELEYKFKFEMLKGHGLLTLLTPKPFEDKKFCFNAPYPESLLLLIDKAKFMVQKDEYPLYWSFHGPSMLDPGERDSEVVIKFFDQIKDDMNISEDVKNYYSKILFKKIEINDEDNEITKYFLEKFKTIPMIRDCLEELSISKDFEIINNLNLFNKLRVLKIENLNHKEDLIINQFSNFEKIYLKNVQNIKTLKIVNCPKFEGFISNSFNNLSVQGIHIESCENFEWLAFKLKNTQKLNTIIIKNCPKFDKSAIDGAIQELVTIK